MMTNHQEVLWSILVIGGTFFPLFRGTASGIVDHIECRYVYTSGLYAKL